MGGTQGAVGIWHCSTGPCACRGPGQPVTTTGATPAQFNTNNILNIAIFRPDINLNAVIEALETNSVLEILAEPNLLTESGKEASFLAGGEFPFPVVQTGSGGVPVVTIQFREFGVRLTFTPTLTFDVSPVILASDVKATGAPCS